MVGWAQAPWSAGLRGTYLNVDANSDDVAALENGGSPVFTNYNRGNALASLSPLSLKLFFLHVLHTVEPKALIIHLSIRSYHQRRHLQTFAPISSIVAFATSLCQYYQSIWTQSLGCGLQLGGSVVTRLRPRDYPALSINPSLTSSGNGIASGLEGMHKFHAWIIPNPLDTPLPLFRAYYACTGLWPTMEKSSRLSPDSNEKDDLHDVVRVPPALS